MVRGTWWITSQHFEFSYGHERGAWSELTTLTSQHFKIRYGGYERGAWSGGDA